MIDKITQEEFEKKYVNTIQCGDCLEILKTWPDKCVDLIVTDPPYGMSYVSNHRREKHEAISGDADLSWLPDFAVESFRVLRDNSHLYCFCSDHAIHLFREALSTAGFSVKRVLVWVKNNWTAGDLDGDYGNRTEFIMFYHKGTRPLYGRRDTNVLEFDRASSKYHPTEKPVSIMSYLLNKSSRFNDLILDPFAGSGTTLVAAKQLGRKYIGIEISEKYVAICKERLKQEQLPL